MDTIVRAVDLKNTCILQVYKRPEYLKRQVNAILDQTFPPSDIWLVVNKVGDTDKDYWMEETIHEMEMHIHNRTKKWPSVFTIDPNRKYHPRFAIGLLADSHFISFFDDDTIPGKRWFESCYNECVKQPGIYGTAGVILNSIQYVDHQRAGWAEPNEETVRCDLVGHAWFMQRSHLPAMWIDPPASLENGEDIQLSFGVQKYTGANTYCPPHPKNDPDRWGSLKGWEFGNDSKASSNGSLMDIPEFYKQRDFCIMYGVQNGWKTVRGIEKMFGG